MKHLELTENVLVPALILAAGVLVVQAHAIPYWQAAMGAAVGLVASLGAELVGLYLVYQPGRGISGKTARGAGLLLVGVMVLVPAWVILQPEYAAWRAADAEAQAAPARHAAAQAVARAQLPDLEADIAKNEVSLRETEEKSATRAGWLGMIEQQQATLAGLRARRDALKATIAAPMPMPDGFDWWGALPRVIPVLALLVAFQLVNAYAVLKIAGWRWGASTEPSVVVAATVRGADAESVRNADANETTDDVRAADADDADTGSTPSARTLKHSSDQHDDESAGADDFTIRRLAETIRGRIADSGLSAAEWSRRERVNPRIVSAAVNHFRLRREGKRTLSDRQLVELATRFLSPAEGAQS